MSRREIYLLVCTFVVGVAAGAYSYLTGFAPVYRDVDFSIGTQYTVLGERYGGGVDAAFSLESDGTYRASVGNGEVLEGVIDESVRRALREALRDADLVALGQSVERARCASEIGGEDVRYEIEVNNERVVLDSCTTSFDRQSVLGVVLEVVWRDIEDI